MERMDSLSALFSCTLQWSNKPCFIIFPSPWVANTRMSKGGGRICAWTDLPLAAVDLTSFTCDAAAFIIYISPSRIEFSSKFHTQSSGDANSNTASTRLKAHSRFEESLLATLVYFHQLQKSLVGGIGGSKRCCTKNISQIKGSLEFLAFDPAFSSI